MEKVRSKQSGKWTSKSGQSKSGQRRVRVGEIISVRVDRVRVDK